MLKTVLISGLLFAASDHGAHVHGSADVNMAFDGKKGKIEFHVPADSLFGFEHEAKSKKDKATKEAALKNLSEKINDMIVFDSKLSCEVKMEIYEVIQKKNHADVEAEYGVHCQSPVAGSTITFDLQKVFPRLKKVKVNVLADGVQKSLETSKSGDSLELK